MRLIHCLWLSLCLWLTACNSAAHPHSLAYITNQGDHTVSVIDIKQQKTIHTIPVDKAPVGIAVSKKLQRAFVTNVEKECSCVLLTVYG